MSIRLDVAALVLATTCYASTTEALAGEDSSPALTWNCAGCHGPDGVSVGSAMPSIAGMDPRYFIPLMRRFGSDERWSTVMGRIARGYDSLELRAMALYFADGDWIPAGVSADADLPVGDAGVPPRKALESVSGGLRAPRRPRAPRRSPRRLLRRFP
ncbi:hypothetical protein CKO31_00960 [Thiohalocapsa halophila]|uniref:Cytochrome c domain-containing protein n=1 Tax=Thiohalocapsa halophila TaxID=69359 RepID=A0ABS1CBN7_9GAMM|nr:hypothetical protein [Thiohalocapsa halophila]MBK1629325.1 hypothetical protein [Thiohalocapsa halophila]